MSGSEAYARLATEDQYADALRAIGIDADTAELAGPTAPHANGVYRSSGSAQSAFQAARTLARKTRSQLVGAHVVLAVANMEHGTAVRALRARGIDIDALAAAAREEAGL
jgi:hypothetical protein